MDYDAILFDLDGVLVQGRATDPSVYEQAARDTIASFDLESEGLVEPLADPHSTQPVRDALGALAVDPETVWRHREHRACEIENEQIRSAGRDRYPDADVLEYLAGDAHLGVVSNNRMNTVSFVCEHFGFDTLLQTWYGRHPTFEGQARMKPDPYYIERALEDIESECARPAPDICDRALYVGDRESDVIAARRAGVDAAFLRRSHNREVRLETDPEHVLDSLEELRLTA